MKKYLIALLITVGIGAVSSPQVHATDSIQIRPLIYRESLNPGETKRGFVDIANASADPVTVHIQAKLFKQTGDDGTLSFYDRPFVQDAIKPDYADVDLQGKDSFHLGFTVDSSKMPSGDVFAALFATTVHKQEPQKITPAVQVGTLMIFENGTPGPRSAQITNLSMPFFQFGDTIHGTVNIKNPANSDTATGFFPKISVSTKPWGPSTSFEGKLIYAGRTRQVKFDTPSNQFGFYKVIINANDAKDSRIVFIMTGIWTWLVPLIFVTLIVAIVVGILFKRKHSRKRS